MTNIIQQARYDGLMRRVGGLLGPGSKVSETLSEVFPIFDLENLPMELLFLAGWRSHFATQLVLTTVGETSRASIFNPAGSGRLVVLTDVYVAIRNTDDRLNAEVITTPFAAVQTSAPQRDTRGGADSAAKLSNLNTGNTNAFFVWWLESERTKHLWATGGLFVLAPGTGLDFGTTADARELDITFFWKERDALPSELSF